MLEDVKTALRISKSQTAFDMEIQDLMQAARLDLHQSGVSSSKTEGNQDDALIKRAIITYCKANFGYDNPDADRFQRSYDMLKQHLTLAGDYRAP